MMLLSLKVIFLSTLFSTFFIFFEIIFTKYSILLVKSYFSLILSSHATLFRGAGRSLRSLVIGFQIILKTLIIFENTGSFGVIVMYVNHRFFPVAEIRHKCNEITVLILWRK